MFRQEPNQFPQTKATRVFAYSTSIVFSDPFDQPSGGPVVIGVAGKVIGKQLKRVILPKNMERQTIR